MAAHQTTIIAVIVIISIFGTIGLLFAGLWWLGTYANRMYDLSSLYWTNISDTSSRRDATAAADAESTASTGGDGTTTG
ncbi:hypothetical protein HYALB_00005686 [Hymenoscyphus albidus]|uniref:Uncharacterized protein n=1 Tax=Hymenoscyphus albidus TaxID=595503 RepID=A0A9N9LMN3_9HELO|nr:hypothetical protein HYALB_00005686 [Hymenoscyphus albidus]